MCSGHRGRKLPLNGKIPLFHIISQWGFKGATPLYRLSRRERRRRKGAACATGSGNKFIKIISIFCRKRFQTVFVCLLILHFTFYIINHTPVKSNGGVYSALALERSCTYASRNPKSYAVSVTELYSNVVIRLFSSG